MGASATGVPGSTPGAAPADPAVFEASKLVETASPTPVGVSPAAPEPNDTESTALAAPWLGDAKRSEASSGGTGDSGEPTKTPASPIVPATPGKAPLDDAAESATPARTPLPASTAGGTPAHGSVPPTRPRPPEPAPYAAVDPAPVAAAPKAPSRGLGFGSLLAASVLGGLVGAGLMAAYDTFGSNEPDLTPRIAAIEERVAQRPPLEPLEQRLTQLEGAQKSAQAGIDSARQLAERGAATAQQALDRPPPAATAASEANAKAIQDLTGRITALEGGVRSANEAAKALEGGVRSANEAARALEGRLAEQQRTLSASIQQAAEQSTRAAQTMQRVAAAERIADAIRTGGPYPQALEVLRRTGADAGRVQAVAPFADSGAPSAAALAAEFRPVAERIASASRTPPAVRDAQGNAQEGTGGDWTGNLMRLADRLVTVRPTGEAAPDAVKAALDRVETALRGGDLRRALDAYEALPEAAKTASQDFGQRLRTRVAAEEAARALAGDAFAALDTPAR
jgi:hypothetical protein